ncbi:hypothetical protein WA158_003896 [Blastocystis sp. Blastoise]
MEIKRESTKSLFVKFFQPYVIGTDYRKYYEIEGKKSVKVQFPNSVSPTKRQQYSEPKVFNKVYLPSDSLEDYYSEVYQPCIEEFMNGRQALFINVGVDPSIRQDFYIGTQSEEGILSLLIDDLLDALNNSSSGDNYRISLSMILSCSEKLYPLFINHNLVNLDETLVVSTDSDRDMYCKGLAEIELNNIDDAIYKIHEGIINQNELLRKKGFKSEDGTCLYLFKLISYKSNRRTCLSRLCVVDLAPPSSKETFGANVVLQSIRNTCSKGMERQINKMWKIVQVLGNFFDGNTTFQNTVFMRTDAQDIERSWDILESTRSRLFDTDGTKIISSHRRSVSNVFPPPPPVSAPPPPPTTAPPPPPSHLIGAYSRVLSNPGTPRTVNRDSRASLADEINKELDRYKKLVKKLEDENKAKDEYIEIEREHIEMEARRQCEYMKVMNEDKNKEEWIMKNNKKAVEIELRIQQEQYRKLLIQKESEIDELRQALCESENEGKRRYQELVDFEEEVVVEEEKGTQYTGTLKKDVVKDIYVEHSKDNKESSSVVNPVLTNDNIQQLQTIISECDEEIQSLNQELSEVEESANIRITELEGEIVVLENERYECVKRIDELEGEAEAYIDKIKKLETENQKLKSYFIQRSAAKQNTPSSVPRPVNTQPPLHRPVGNPSTPPRPLSQSGIPAPRTLNPSTIPVGMRPRMVRPPTAPNTAGTRPMAPLAHGTTPLRTPLQH